MILSKGLFSFKVLDVGINDVKENVFGAGIHFLYIVDTLYSFFIVRGVFPCAD